VLIAQVATTGGVRAPLAHVANQVFLDLVRDPLQLRASLSAGTPHRVDDEHGLVAFETVMQWYLPFFSKSRNAMYVVVHERRTLVSVMGIGVECRPRRSTVLQ